ncbi:hypothetical protein E2C01_066488 [Portunus trituberculatus]|uniref:Uncharacterized protein n=1 Tax=Portunus trituberculatus TaxID=210409 RepID=A0A5B7HH78_PORTR|nr:hypothetical protein [Portunus trituberculatus]
MQKCPDIFRASPQTSDSKEDNGRYFRKPYPTTSGTTQTMARRKIDVHSCVITHDEFLEAVEETEKMILEKKKKAEEKQRNRTTRKRKEVSSGEDEDVDNFLGEFEEETRKEKESARRKDIKEEIPQQHSTKGTQFSRGGRC